MITTAYRYNDAQPEWMFAIQAAWRRKTDLPPMFQTELLKEWRLNSIKLVVDYDLLLEEGERRGLIRSDICQPYS